MIIAIDGNAGCGKSTIAKMLSERLGIYLLNSGNFYRAITYLHLKLGRDPEDRELCIKTARDAEITIEDGLFLVDGRPVSDRELHDPSIDLWSSKISVIREVREAVNERLRRIGENLDLVCEGRDITTVVFPNADFKFFFTASPEVRAERRHLQYPEVPYETILREIIERDKIDTEKPFGGLKKAKDAVLIDTTYLTINDVCVKVLAEINART